MARTPSKEPTDGELEILKILWAIGPAGLGQVHEALRARKDVALTTVATVLKMMHAKNLIDRTDGPRGYLWSARLSRKSAASGLVGKLVRHVFDGSARRLVAHLVEDGQLSEKERQEILEVLKSRPDSRASGERKGAGR
jgi:BlaI family transcriptional regulator, penicillinase repressor